MKKKNTVLLMFMLVVGTAAAQSKTDNGVYVGLEGAYAKTSLSDKSGSGIEFRRTSETSGVGALRVLLGYQLNKNLALELGYFNTGDFKEAGQLYVGSLTTEYGIKRSYKGGDLSLLYKFTEGVPGLFLKAGISHSKRDLSLTAFGISDSVSDSGTGYVAGLGYEFNISNSWDARLAYTRYERLAGNSDDKLNLFSVGVKYGF